MPEKKVSKESVRYRPAEDPSQSCGSCVMRRGSSCTLVVGTISTGSVCDRWYPDLPKKPDEVGLARPYQRAEDGKTEEVSGYELHKMLGPPRPEDVKPLVDYSHNGYFNLNSELWEDSKLDKKAAGLEQHLDAAFAAAKPLEKPAVVYRDPAFSDADDNDHRLQVIHLPAGAKALSVMNARKAKAGRFWAGDEWDEEKEVLLPRGSVLHDEHGRETHVPGYLSTSSNTDTPVLVQTLMSKPQHLYLQLPGDDVRLSEVRPYERVEHGRWQEVHGYAQTKPVGSWENLDKLIQDEFHPQKLDADKLKHPKSGYMLDAGISRQVAQPQDDKEGPAEFKVLDHGTDFRFFPTPLPNEPIQHVYRGMSLDEWNQAVRRGYIQSDQRGTVANWEGTNAAVTPNSAFSYLPGDGSAAVVAKIRVDPAEKWFTIHQDSYLRTREKIPLARVEHVSPVVTGGAKGFEVSSTRPEEHDALAAFAREVLDDVRQLALAIPGQPPPGPPSPQQAFPGSPSFFPVGHAAQGFDTVLMPGVPWGLPVVSPGDSISGHGIQPVRQVPGRYLHDDVWQRGHPVKPPPGYPGPAGPPGGGAAGGPVGSPARAGGAKQPAGGRRNAAARKT